uniref:Uncharacterized protein n=1 Tax=Glossina pallidipes TaxID=7398 RepID=A0A1A9ZMZ5_GLOPL
MVRQTWNNNQPIQQKLAAADNDVDIGNDEEVKNWSLYSLLCFLFVRLKSILLFGLFCASLKFTSTSVQVQSTASAKFTSTIIKKW